LDAAKAHALGARLTGMARPFLVAASRGDGAVREFLDLFLRELRTAAFLTGCADLAALNRLRPLITGRVRDWLAFEP